TGRSAAADRQYVGPRAIDRQVMVDMQIPRREFNRAGEGIVEIDVEVDRVPVLGVVDRPSQRPGAVVVEIPYRERFCLR
ncbi:hypothetical protein ACFLSF_02540, partial [Candidatus Bipolaricaulota bacterium]